MRLAFYLHVETLTGPRHFTKRGGLSHETSLTPPLFVGVPVPKHVIVWSCIFVLGISVLFLSTILIFDIGIIPTVWWVFFHSIYCCYVAMFLEYYFPLIYVLTSVTIIYEKEEL